MPVNRVVSSESDAWVAAMDDKTVENGKKKEMLRVAATKHIERAKKAGNGLGVDRHLLGVTSCHDTLMLTDG
jgi:carnitine O-acetyltransferase